NFKVGLAVVNHPLALYWKQKRVTDMADSTFSSTQTARLADRIAAAQRQHFVGRKSELELFRSALLDTEPPFVVLHLYGPGGIGKTTLLHEFVHIAQSLSIPAIRLDGRNLNPSPSEFLLALGLD